jgi:hypothetical protein
MGTKLGKLIDHMSNYTSCTNIVCKPKIKKRKALKQTNKQTNKPSNKQPN